MIIDFHTHIFPDKIAKRTIELLSEKGDMTPFSDGTVYGLIEAMEKAGTDISVTLPVLTSPSQFESVNRFAAEINEVFSNKDKRLISFAGIHPLCENIEEKMLFIKKSGFLGIKIHPDYQGTFIDDPAYIKILQCAKEYDLIVVTHSGVDCGFRDMPVRCTPERILNLVDKVKHPKLVLAHYGANEMFEEVLDKLCGLDVYFDTAIVLPFIKPELFKKILKNHGEDRILFATDSPWSDIYNDVEILKSYYLNKDTQNKLFFENAAKLLGIQI